ncbi:MAG: oxidoreductase [Cutibacterium avidum]|uniref:NAD(P)H-dependent oxidoreductase n=1 Tax=Cutibacterium avidum TaxID=33010 RepID=UPI0022E564F1|nr:oxidoreductase [Cutibacterium avidum]MBS5744571.1 oxidoreductase [Propionibacterium sp.]MDU2096010.1 hypothetical protein [Negativicoccus succinicivorans]MDK7359990.1 oxidoreductase [Cutibacterium avidum]MDK7373208.1 oxidoreductase [Cutibacterium avidum]MDU3218580.1 oxidoreductase [Cutibacterium avidum]
MGYTTRLLDRQAKLGRPVRVGIVGAGQMGRGLIAQVHLAEGLEVVAVADIDVDRATGALKAAGCDDVVVAQNVDEAAQLIEDGRSVAIDDGLTMPKLPVDFVLEVSGVPEVAAQVAYAAIVNGKDVGLMTVEADVTVGLLLSSMANSGNSVYTVCRGDEPIECVKLIEYAEDLGLDVVAAGKGKNNPNRPTDVPEDVMDEAHRKKMNPKMLCSFTDGTKTQIEMCALSNASGFKVEVPGMHGIKCDVDDLAKKLVPATDGGIIEGKEKVVEYVTGDVAPGVFAIVRSDSPVVTEELQYLHLGDGPYFALYRPFHLASIEADLSIGEAVLDRSASFQSKTWTSEVTARAKTDLKAGTTLEGIGGHHVHGWTIDAADARDKHAVPIGVVAGCVLKRDVPAGTILTEDDVEIDETRPIVAMRRLQDALLDNGTIG